MLQHYLSTALRHFRRHKLTTAINVLCLAFGIVCFALSYGMAKYTSRGDLYHEKAARMFALTQRSEVSGSTVTYGTAPIVGWGFAPLLRADYPELAHVARATRSAEVAVAAGSAKTFANVSYADAEFLDVFDLPFVVGDRRAALRSGRSAVISEELARQLFGRADVLGAEVILNSRHAVRIAGVVSEPPQPTHIMTRASISQWVSLQFSLLVSMDVLEAMRQDRGPDATSADARFMRGTTFTYLVFPENSALTASQLQADLERFAARHVPNESGRVILRLQPASRINAIMGDIAMQTDVTGVSSNTVMLLLGILILGIACLNYANLASAQATTYLKEIALHRVAGAKYLHVFGQYVAEALVLVLVASAIALALLPMLVENLQHSMGYDLGSALLGTPGFWIAMAALAIGVALIASVYPALVAARVRPAYALHSGHPMLGKRRVMRWLVAGQFVAASFLLIATYGINLQVKGVLDLSSAFPSDQIVMVTNNFKDAGVDRELVRGELGRLAAVRSVSGVDVAPGNIFGAAGLVMADAAPASRRWMVATPTIDFDFFPTTGVRLLAGRDFDKTRAEDVSSADRRGNVVIDRALARQYGWLDPQDAVGKSIFVPDSGLTGAVGVPRTVIGVVDDQALYVAKRGNAATMYSVDPSRSPIVLVRLRGEDIGSGLRAVDDAWSALAPNVPLKRRFLDEQFEETYRTVNAGTPIFRFLCVFALLIAAMGLVGIATHALSQRTFEIGVRKTLGASIGQVFAMLLRDFSRPVVIANLIAWPFGFIVAKGISMIYASPAPITVLPFIGTLGLTLLIAWLAVARRAIGAARVRPAEVLRYE